MEIKVLTNVLKANDALAEENQEFFRKQGMFVLNLISSPGAGKTTVLEKTLEYAQKSLLKISVIEGDIATTLDAQRIGKFERPVMQINTGGGCHLDANQVKKAIQSGFISDDTNLLIIENVGNLVCPAEYNLGEDYKVVVLSVAEGDDKPVKYPSIFTKAHVVIINKIDLLGLCDFDLEKAKKDITQLNPEAIIFEISARKETGIDTWINWLETHINVPNSI
ncbi:MAG: hydrogenase accessory protein HypB [Candidatus Margulisiibacteriota bacterium]|nr:MAG: hydrogenase accessory protein HypB [Candidatus Margulisbacteria bacterium GWD2_39_127]OGI03581.1 MAG: hydrogenase accessory protein HypB [Candidatus Margulisbacteria bacterium GWF2_38_17]OGI11085.1 MAG: hydrogenase accessory protein HypB [Candidatus Margulisbacteria bacterium GWE2_39_32]PZM77085.1 MAG: hydrogenase accessory protein HypB [Candidatus Margulisiibacteriota bacterium]HAR62318.1 hydrogenase accessory protein HypB [Candidatus Margulisiibacteriota bacterium]